MKNEIKTKNSEPNYNLKSDSSDNKRCLLKFSMCHDKYPMEKLERSEIKEFVTFAKKVENAEWKDIKKNKSLHYETLDSVKLPSNISKDITTRSMRVSKKFRIIGYRQDEFFYIVWFDKNHKTC